MIKVSAQFKNGLSKELISPIFFSSLFPNSVKIQLNFLEAVA